MEQLGTLTTIEEVRRSDAVNGSKLEKGQNGPQTDKQLTTGK
jgi:hypothetical protein